MSKIKSTGSSLFPIKIRQTLRTYMAKRDFLTGIAIYRSNSKHLIGKPNRSTNDTQIKE